MSLGFARLKISFVNSIRLILDSWLILQLSFLVLSLLFKKNIILLIFLLISYQGIKSSSIIFSTLMSAISFPVNKRRYFLRRKSSVSDIVRLLERPCLTTSIRLHLSRRSQEASSRSTRSKSLLRALLLKRVRLIWIILFTFAPVMRFAQLIIVLSLVSIGTCPLSQYTVIWFTNKILTYSVLILIFVVRQMPLGAICVRMVSQSLLGEKSAEGLLPICIVSSVTCDYFSNSVRLLFASCALSCSRTLTTFLSLFFFCMRVVNSSTCCCRLPSRYTVTPLQPSL